MKIMLLVCVLFNSMFVIGQELDSINEIISLAKIYRNNHGLSNLDGGYNKELFNRYEGTQFETVAKFIQEGSLY